jgi:hypothetical protein
LSKALQAIDENNKLLKKIYSASENVRSVKAKEYEPNNLNVLKCYNLIAMTACGQAIHLQEDDVMPSRNRPIFHAGTMSSLYCIFFS